MAGLSHSPSTPPLLRLRVEQSLLLPGRLRVAGSAGRLRVAIFPSQNSTSRTPGLDTYPSSLISIDPAPFFWIPSHSSSRRAVLKTTLSASNNLRLGTFNRHGR